MARTIASLPEPNFKALQLLFLLFVKIVQKSAVNLMNPTNLAIVFAPTLLRSATLEPLQIVADSQRCTGCVCHMIQNAEVLFLDAEFRRKGGDEDYSEYGNV